MTYDDFETSQFEIDAENDRLNAMVAADERRADEEAAAYDPTYACVGCGAVMADPCTCGPRPASHERRVAYAHDCPWENPAAVGPALLELFTDAGLNSKGQPRLRALYLDGIKLSLAGSSSSNPGGLWITDGGSWGDSEYYGSVRADGTMRMTRAWGGVGTAHRSEMLKRLAAFGPMELARIGKAVGRCCYCGRELTDPVSVALGYGPVCAKYHHLPHSAQAAGLVVAA